MHEPSLESLTERYPMLMESVGTNENQVHVIDMEWHSVDSSSGSSLDGPAPGRNEDRQSVSIQVSISQSSPSNGLNSGSSSITRREQHSSHRHWSPFSIIFWLCIDLMFTLAQIIAAIIVLSISRNEKPRAPLFSWIVGYASGCAVSLPIIIWRFLNRSQAGEQESTHLHQDSSSLRSNSESTSSITVSLTQTMEEDGHYTSPGPQNNQTVGDQNARFNLLADRLKMALDCFFAVWFIVGNIWIFGGHSSLTDAPNLYRLCIVFLTISCIGYAMPLILCSMICCCLPCIISILGVRDDMNQMRGASEETINGLPMHKFKSKEKGSPDGDSNSGVGQGGLVAAGTEKECLISGEDAVCCICLERYEDNDELRELPCSHFFHKECADTWLKINATCPLCKSEIGDRKANLSSTENVVQQV